MTRHLGWVLVLACGASCKKSDGSWPRSRDQLCTEIDLLHHEVRRKLDDTVADLAKIPAKVTAETERAEAETKKSEPPPKPFPPLTHGGTPYEEAAAKVEATKNMAALEERAKDRCEYAIRDLPELQGMLRGFHQAAGAVDMGRPEAVVDTLSTELPTSFDFNGLCDVHLPATDSAAWSQQYVAKTAAKLQDANRAMETGFASSLAMCVKTGWKSVLDPLPPLPAGSGSAGDHRQ